jgi:hypothetical protein
MLLYHLRQANLYPAVYSQRKSQQRLTKHHILQVPHQAVHSHCREGLAEEHVENCEEQREKLHRNEAWTEAETGWLVGTLCHFLPEEGEDDWDKAHSEEAGRLHNTCENDGISSK